METNKETKAFNPYDIEETEEIMQKLEKMLETMEKRKSGGNYSVKESLAYSKICTIRDSVFTLQNTIKRMLKI